MAPLPFGLSVWTSLGLNKPVPIFPSYKNRPCWRCLEDVVIIAQRSRPVSVNDAPNLAKKEWLGLLLIISHLCSAWVSPSDIICSRANTHSVSFSLSLSVLLSLALFLSVSLLSVSRHNSRLETQWFQASPRVSNSKNMLIICYDMFHFWTQIR